MNQKIEELSEIADDYADDYLQCQGEFHPDWHTVRDNKFAQMIIEECIDICGSYYSVEGIAQNIVKDIKETFGVE